jgi:hypothetical protein
MVKRLRCWRHLVRSVATTLALVFLLVNGHAFADDTTPLVRATIDEKGVLAFDRPVPASQTFDLELISERPKFNAGRVDVWPERLGACASVPKGAEPRKRIAALLIAPSDQRQHHSVALVPVSDSGLATNMAAIRGRVPALQLNETFCFVVKRSAELDDTGAQAVADDLGSTVIRVAAANEDLTAALSQGLADALVSLFGRAVVLSPETTDKLAAKAARLLRATPEYGHLLEAGAKLADTRQQRQDIEQKFAQATEAARNTLSAQPLAPIPKPRLFAGEPLLLVEPQQLFEMTPEAIKQGLDQLQALRQEASAVDQRSYEDWISALNRYLVVSDDAKKQQLRRAQRAQLPAVSPFKFWDAPSHSFVASGDVAAHPNRIAADALIDALRAYREVPGASALAADAWSKILSPLRTATKRRQEVELEISQRQADWSSAQAAAALAFPKGIKSALTQAGLELEFKEASVQGGAGTTTTPAAINVISVDAALVAAFPQGGTSETAWLVPTLGLNIYFVPVERTVPLGQLVGCWWWQHFSLTVGLSLVAPSVPGRTAVGPVLGQYGELGAGIRLGQYVRFAGGALVYQLNDPNPGSVATKLTGAPYLGFSADFDAIRPLFDALSTTKK